MLFDIFSLAQIASVIVPASGIVLAQVSLDGWTKAGATGFLGMALVGSLFWVGPKVVKYVIDFVEKRDQRFLDALDKVESGRAAETEAVRKLCESISQRPCMVKDESER